MALLGMYPDVRESLPFLGGTALVCVATVSLNACYCVSAICKAHGKPALACFLEHGSAAALAALLLHAAHYLGLDDIGMFASALAFLAASTLIFAFACLREKELFRGSTRPVPAGEDMHRISTLARPLLFTNLLAILQAQGAVLMAFLFVAPEDVGYFSAAFQLSTAFTFALVVANIMLPSLLREQVLNAEKTVSMRTSVQRITALVLIVSCPAFVVFYVYPGALTLVFGDGFDKSRVLLLILLAGQLLNLLSGPSGMLLKLTGSETTVFRITLFSTALNIILVLVLTPFFGVSGTAIAVSVSLGLQSLGLLLAVRMALGFWSLPLGIRRQPGGGQYSED
jgi:O-antigen/teichoic acid export membrane protein